MSEEAKVPSGEPSQEPVVQSEGNAEGVNADGVSYDTHRKLLGEKKKVAQELALAQEKLKQFELSQQELKEKELKDNEKWQEFAEEQKKKAAEMEAQLNSYRDREVYQAKVAKVVGSVEGLSSKYHHLIDADAIEYDASTGEVDESSLQKEVERIKANYPEVLMKTQSAAFDSRSPQPNGQAKLTAQEYARLSRDQKKARAGELGNVPDWMLGK